jgi:hypothetical protein
MSKSKGVLIFAHNSDAYNYYDMAEYTAKRVNHFLDLPATIVTDSDSLPHIRNYAWDNIIIEDPDKNNLREWGVWINKGRYQAFEHSPYEETILLDADYIVNSDNLLKIFDCYDDFMCHDKTNFLMYPHMQPDKISTISYDMLWATVVAFKKTKRAEQIFGCLEMVQKNYEHYANIHGFVSQGYRNDYGMTLALRIANGHLIPTNDFIPWRLTHIGRATTLYKNTDDEFNTEYTVLFDNWQKNKIRKEYITIKNFDFHMLNKDNAVEIMNG